ncbi:MAG: phosphoribosylformylglycinamidine cyclo-ligase [Acidobacteria bacterium]|nr:phosphoribosylformylglycinamidine cyclo-ligase [Acidobacteriota bacterium]
MDGKLTYRESGVDIDAQDQGLLRVKEIAKSTFTRGVLSEIGLFGGLFALNPDDPAGDVLVASADGVGTKLKVAQLACRYDTVGQDLVNHCTNDILVQGAKPLFFLDYFAAGKLVPERLAQVVEGLGKACRENGCALLGGETAEMPGLYAGEDFDLAGFIVGVVKRDKALPKGVSKGDVLVALPSTGLHTNGYSLARRLFFEVKKLKTDTYLSDLGCTVGEALLAVHRSYFNSLYPLLQTESGIHGMAHITGGGIVDNLPRILPQGVAALIQESALIRKPAIFGYIQREGNVDPGDMRRTFNMGVGMILCVSQERLDAVVGALKAAGEAPWVIGELLEGNRTVTFA